jgi:hypothetical protein
MSHHNLRREGVHTTISIYAAASVEALTFFGWLNDRAFVEKVEFMGVEYVVHQYNFFA